MGLGSNVDVKSRWYQDEAVKSTIDYIRSNPGKSPVIVIPTGGGKTIVIDMLVKQLNAKVLILSHSKEILEQNFESLSKALPSVGLYSASLGLHIIRDVTVAGIQSVYRKSNLFARFKYIIIDEAHLISNSQDSMYNTFLGSLKVPCIGLTATPYRLNGGLIYGPGKMFDAVSFNVSSKRLTEEGYLSPLKVYGSTSEFNTEGVATQAGDFKLSDLSLRFDREAVSSQIVNDLLKYKENYKHWLVFCIDIAHAENVSNLLNKAGITCEAVHSESPRDQSLIDFKDGKIQAVTNVNILTVGFNYPEIDLIAVLRPTKSPTLHVQLLGRGCRTSKNKKHCLVKDYSGNIRRLGMVDDVKVNINDKKAGTGENPFMKTCPECELLNYPAVRQCECGYKFKFEHNLSPTSYTSEPKWYTVSDIKYSIHHKANSPDSLKISYICGVRVFDEYILIEHPGYAGYKAKHMLKNRWGSDAPQPTTIMELKLNCDKLKRPKQICVDDFDKYPKIIKMI